jgi:hypothetical protein
MVQCGGRRWRRVGLLIATGGGCTNLIGDGPGFLMIRGAGLLITTAAGCISMAGGDGGRVRRMDIRFIVRSGRRLMSRSLDLEVDSDLALASVMADGDRSAGCHWDHATISIRGMDTTVDASARWDTAATTAVDSLRCTGARDSRM